MAIIYHLILDMLGFQINNINHIIHNIIIEKTKKDVQSSFLQHISYHLFV